MGGTGSTSRDAAELTGQVRMAYEAATQSWSAGPEAVYAALAAALVSQAAPFVSGARVLDLGAGTGVVGRAALAAGAAEVVAADLAVGLLREASQSAEGKPALRPLVAEAVALPFRDDSFGLVAAGFSLTHVGNLSAALRESRRVGQVLAASTFAPGWTHPAKVAVDAVLTRFGYRAPSWYLMFKHDTEPAFSDAGRFCRLAVAAGYRDCDSIVLAVPTGLSAASELAAWRLGMAHVAPFVRALDPARQRQLRHSAEAAINGADPLTCADPLVVSMQVYLAVS